MKKAISGRNDEFSFIIPAVLISLLFSALVLVYIFSASVDVVYSDYIRLVNEYLPDVCDLNKILVPDILTRTPLAFLFRFINCELFHYSVDFDRMISVVCIFITSLIWIVYYKRMNQPLWVWGLILPVFFSLSKRDMLLNGTGYIHFMTYIPFFIQFLFLDQLYRAENIQKAVAGLTIIPMVTILLTSGPYCATFVVTVLVGYIVVYRKTNHISQRDQTRLVVSLLVPFLLYLISNSFAEEDLAGAYDVSLWEAIMTYPLLFPKFLLNGLASAVLGGDLLEYLTVYGYLSRGTVYLLGFLVLLSYIAAIVIYVKEKIYLETLVPFLMILMGFGNHLIVFIGRYFFLSERYSWSSRYFLQYQVGAIGIIMVAGMSLSKRRTVNYRKVKDTFLYRHGKEMLMIGAVFLLLGNLISTGYEIREIPDRRYLFEYMEQTALDYKNVEDDVLNTVFEYRPGADKVRNAFRILEENHLNVFWNNTSK